MGHPQIKGGCRFVTMSVLRVRSRIYESDIQGFFLVLASVLIRFRNMDPMNGIGECDGNHPGYFKAVGINQDSGGKLKIFTIVSMINCVYR